MTFNWKLIEIVGILGNENKPLDAKQIALKSKSFSTNSISSYIHHNLSPSYIKKTKQKPPLGHIYELTDLGWDVFNKYNLRRVDS